MTTPCRPGHYWVMWIDTEPDSTIAAAPSREWEVVLVFENSLVEEDPQRLLVFVPGEDKPQGLDKFNWGPGPLRPPVRTAILPAGGPLGASDDHPMDYARGWRAQLDGLSLDASWSRSKRLGWGDRRKAMGRQS